MLLISLDLPAGLSAHGQVTGRRNNILLLLLELLMKAIDSIAHVVARRCIVHELDGIRAGDINALSLLILLLVAAMRIVPHWQVHAFATGVCPHVPLALLIIRDVGVLHQDLVRGGRLCMLRLCVLVAIASRLQAGLVRVLARRGDSRASCRHR